MMNWWPELSHMPSEILDTLLTLHIFSCCFYALFIHAQRAWNGEHSLTVFAFDWQKCTFRQWHCENPARRLPATRNRSSGVLPASSNWQHCHLNPMCVYMVFCAICLLLIVYCCCCLNADNNLMAYDIWNLCARILRIFTCAVSPGTVYVPQKQLNLCQRCDSSNEKEATVFLSWNLLGAATTTLSALLLLIKLWMLEYDFWQFSNIMRMYANEMALEACDCQHSDAAICWISTIYQSKQTFVGRQKKLEKRMCVCSYVRCRRFAREIDNLWIFMVSRGEDTDCFLCWKGIVNTTHTRSNYFKSLFVAPTICVSSKRIWCQQQKNWMKLAHIQFRANHGKNTLRRLVIRFGSCRQIRLLIKIS